MTLLLPRLRTSEALELSCKANLGVWAERKRWFVNAPFHWEWYDLVQEHSRICIVAPREHAKSECITINQISWRSIYWPLHWSYVFALTGDQAKEMLSRINLSVEQAAPWMLEGPEAGGNQTEMVYANGSRVTVAGAGKAVRGAHPDLIVGDDVLEEGNSLTYLQRKRMERWWLGTIGGMSHPGTWRTKGQAQVWMPPTRVCLVGTPFHQQDLLMSLRDNPVYTWRRYAAEFDPADRDGYAVEAA